MAITDVLSPRQSGPAYRMGKAISVACALSEGGKNDYLGIGRCGSHGAKQLVFQYSFGTLVVYGRHWKPFGNKS